MSVSGVFIGVMTLALFPVLLGIDGEAPLEARFDPLSFHLASSLVVLFLGLPGRSGGLYIHSSPASLHRRQGSLPYRMHRCLRL